ncbi:MAG: GTP-binding protein [Candidatus Heimdallarchaeota archaeon]|nr:GTP-binding protein [Candidatus Heimdallarchaeota archaeon]
MEPILGTKFQPNEDSLNILKIVLVGDSKVGKTTLVNALARRGISERGYSVSFELPLQEDDSDASKMKGIIYDLRSQRYFPYLHSLFYHGAKGAIIVFDVTNKESYSSILKWRNIIWGHVGNVPLLLCGNKSDLRQNNSEQATIKEIKELAKNLTEKRHFPISYLEISAIDRIIAYSESIGTPNEEEDIYPTIDAFRKPFENWLIQIVKKGKIPKSYLD